MPIDAMPDLPYQHIPVMVAQAKGTGHPMKEKFDRVIGICHLAMNPPVPATTAVNSLSPVLEVKDYLVKFEHRRITTTRIISRVLQQPKHGTLEDGGGGDYVYVPTEAGYIGKDEGAVLVEMSDLRIKVTYFFRILDSLPTDSDEEKYCRTYKWRISQGSSSNVA